MNKGTDSTGATPGSWSQDESEAFAEFLAWSAVHGLAMLLIDDPLRDLASARARDIGRRLLDMVERGL